jgi:hypothetical protein
MSLVLEKHRHHVLESVSAYKAKIAEIEGDIRLKAISNDTSDTEIRILQRLKDECITVMYQYEGLNEAFEALLGPVDIAAE